MKPIPTTTAARPIQIIASFRDSAEVAARGDIFHLPGYQVADAFFTEAGDSPEKRVVVVLEKAA